jgi:hypothetical protein
VRYACGGNIVHLVPNILMVWTKFLACRRS